MFNHQNEDEVIENCKTVCQLTHYDPRCDSCQIQGLIITRVKWSRYKPQSILNSLPNLDKGTVDYIRLT